jgi:nuclear inhibitor of protein phosphatase 1
MTDTITKRMQSFPYASQLYDTDTPETGGTPISGLSFAAKLGLRLPNLAPDVDDATPPPMPQVSLNPVTTIKLQPENQNPLEPKKKKYAKEAWPGKKPAHSLLV